MSKESEFRKLFDEVGQKYFQERNKSVKHAASFLYEMDAFALVGDQHIWLN